ncbi:MAG: selenium-dependent molybdenum cofactor biosynthesis protein YqeB [bacterium]
MNSITPSDKTVVVRGAGDLGSGVIYRLWRTGFNPLVLERQQPVTVRRQVAYATAVYDGTTTVQGVKAKQIQTVDEVDEFTAEIPVLVDEEATSLNHLKPDILVDATMPRYSDKVRSNRSMAPLTIGLGPGFRAGDDVEYVIETNRGHDLGRVIEQGSAEDPTGEPGEISGETYSRVLRAPREGQFETSHTPGDTVEKGDRIGQVNGQPVKAGVSGCIRGLIQPGITVSEGVKIGDVDPRGELKNVPTISDKALAIAGGVLEAIFFQFYRKSGGEVEPG